MMCCARWRAAAAVPVLVAVGMFFASLGAGSALARSLLPEGRHKAGVFDYYTFVLSWSPTYCAENGARDRQQCGMGRRFSFVVHGLWPQYEKGWPQNCRVADSWVPKEVIRGMLDIMPSKRLVIHEWRKHGTCSGLSARTYFQVTRKFYEVIKVPARYVAPSKTLLVTPQQIVKDFVATNLWLKPDMISVQCGNRRDRARLREIRFCFTRKGAPRACGHNERRACRAKVLVMPPVR